MKWAKKTGRLPVKSWCEEVEDGAMAQVDALAEHPALDFHVALMPDCHQGYGMPIGGVVASQKAVIPNAVGVDIGCGMRALHLPIGVDEVTTDMLGEWTALVRLKVPVGFSSLESPATWEGFDHLPPGTVAYKHKQKASTQLGTLGGGNHFIEVQADEDGGLWLMVHSGSRNVGLQIAKVYNDMAREQCARWHSQIPNDDLAFLPMKGPGGGEDYWREMQWALAYAKENRRRIMLQAAYAAALAFRATIDMDECGLGQDVHHNYAAIENHFGKNVVIHRKGATSARDGQPGIIPGSMGTASYIVRGKGEPQSFTSCSHGAGRVMGRKDASRRLTAEEVAEAMEGVVFSGYGKDRKGNPDYGEAPQAYKDIDAVMEAQSDLVEIVHRLRPLAVVKG
jgi:tRNA-splicing ligase RtcB (3'-phosphate/5'-hydroxy nucleic acid ligase)